MMVHLSVMPVNNNASLSGAVAKALKIIADSGLEYKLTPMGTLLTGDWQQVMDVVKKCHDAVRDEHDRVVTQIKIDDVKGKNITFDDKVKAVEKQAGIQFKR